MLVFEIWWKLHPLQWLELMMKKFKCQCKHLQESTPLCNIISETKWCKTKTLIWALRSAGCLILAASLNLHDLGLRLCQAGETRTVQILQVRKQFLDWDLSLKGIFPLWEKEIGSVWLTPTSKSSIYLWGECFLLNQFLPTSRWAAQTKYRGVSGLEQSRLLLHRLNGCYAVVLMAPSVSEW